MVQSNVDPQAIDFIREANILFKLNRKNLTGKNRKMIRHVCEFTRGCHRQISGALDL